MFNSNLDHKDKFSFDLGKPITIFHKGAYICVKRDVGDWDQASTVVPGYWENNLTLKVLGTLCRMIWGLNKSFGSNVHLYTAPLHLSSCHLLLDWKPLPLGL